MTPQYKFVARRGEVYHPHGVNEVYPLVLRVKVLFQAGRVVIIKEQGHGWTRSTEPVYDTFAEAEDAAREMLSV
jgi:hypothetical protein